MADERDVVRNPRRENARSESTGESAERVTTSGNSYAVVVGINEYEDAKIPNLRFARADAEAFYQVLTDPEVGRFHPDRTTLLRDAGATRSAILIAIDELSYQVGAGDTVVIYFAGHGAPLVARGRRTADGTEKYLLPHDARADRLRPSAISMHTLHDFLTDLTSRRVVCFLDCCYSGGATVVTPGDATVRGFAHTDMGSRASLTDEYLDQLAGNGRIILTACGASELSLEREELGHGLFSYRLIKGLRGEADKQEQTGRVSVDQLYRYVRQHVQQDALRIGGRMQPKKEGVVDGEVYLTRYETHAQRRSREASVRAAEALARGALEEAQELWREAVEHDSNNAIAANELEAVTRELAAQQQEFERKRDELEKLYPREITGKEFTFAMTLLKKPASNLTELERALLQFVDDLVDGQIGPADYRRLVERATVAAAREVHRATVADTHEVLSKPRKDTKVSPPQPETTAGDSKRDEAQAPVSAAARPPENSHDAAVDAITEARLVRAAEPYRGPDCLVGADILEAPLRTVMRTFAIRPGEHVIALISADPQKRFRYGLVVSGMGIHWRNNPFTSSKPERFIPWRDFIPLEIRSRGEHWVDFGEGNMFSLAGSEMTPARLTELLERLQVAFWAEPSTIATPNQAKRGSGAVEEHATRPRTGRSAFVLPAPSDVLAVINKRVCAMHMEVITAPSSEVVPAAVQRARDRVTALVLTKFADRATITICVTEQGVYWSTAPDAEATYLSWQEFSVVPILLDTSGVFVGQAALATVYGWASLSWDAVHALRDLLELLRSLQALTHV